MKRNLGRRIALGFAVASFASALLTLVAFVIMFGRYGSANAIVASLMASIVFFVGCGIVLYVISQPPRHELLPWDHDETADGAAHPAD